jgi:hypothetical protein
MNQGPYMPIIYIVYKNKRSGISRKILVIDQQPFYCSSGENSGTQGRWLPFILFYGTKNLYTKLSPKIYSEKKLEQSLEGSFPGYLIKASNSYLLNPVIPPFMKINEEFGTEEEIQRMGDSKKWLIISSRLDGHHYTDKQLHNAGLTLEQIEEAKKPFIIEENPSIILSDPDEINQWLIDQGAHQLDALFSPYQKIWKSASDEFIKRKKDVSSKEIKEASNKDIEDLNLYCAEAIFQDYAKNDSTFKLWITLHAGRSFTNEISKALEKKSYSSTSDLVISIKDKVAKSGKKMNPQGSLAKRSLFVEKMIALSHFSEEVKPGPYIKKM